MSELVELLKQQSLFFPSAETLNDFLSHGDTVCYNANDSVIQIGEVNPHIYILKDGVLQKSVLHDNHEITLSFAMPGTMFLSYDSYLLNEPSCIRISACCRCEILRIDAGVCRRMLEAHKDFALWILSIAQYQLYTYDLKSSIVQGDALSRFNRLLGARPDIIKCVPLKMIASYLGISQQHLSRIRRGHWLIGLLWPPTHLRNVLSQLSRSQ